MATAPSGGGGSRVRALLLALTVGLVLADSSVVTLALPAILRDFDASVNAVAWVLISFNLALALVALSGARLARGRAQRAFLVSVALFIVACIACATAPSLGVLIGARAAQGLIGAVVVAAALELLVLSTGRDRAVLLWAAAGVLGAAVGPALGGFLTEWLSWEAMFALQAPVALLGLLGAWGVRGGAGAGTDARSPRAGADARSPRPALAPLLALTLASAALSAALFLLVILLIEGWRHSPAEAALTVTVMPIAALIAGQWARARHGLVPAIAGSLLVAGGLAALGLMPGAHAYWTLAPQLAIGTGLGLALATLIGASVGDAGAGDARTAAAAVAGPAAWTVAARHAGIVIGLLLLTPIFTADLESVRPPAERAGLSQVLDAPLSLPAKIELARRLDAEVQKAADEELPDLDAAFAGIDVPAGDRAAVARLHEQLDEELDRGATEAFSSSFLIAALIALLAAGAALAGARGSGRGAAAGGSPSSSNGSCRGTPGGGGAGRDGRCGAARRRSHRAGRRGLRAARRRRSLRAARAPGERRAHPAGRARRARRDGLQARHAARGLPARAARRRAAGGRLGGRARRRVRRGHRPGARRARAERAGRGGAAGRAEDRRAAGDHRPAAAGGVSASACCASLRGSGAGNGCDPGSAPVQTASPRVCHGVRFRARGRRSAGVRRICLPVSSRIRPTRPDRCRGARMAPIPLQAGKRCHPTHAGAGGDAIAPTS